MTTAANKKPTAPKRDAARSKRNILAAALKEFAEHGLAGARIDVIADRAGVSKPMIYAYFGDKNELYKAALRESYLQIRSGERMLETDGKTPEESIRELVRFTLNHFISQPWFISMLNTENLLGGETVRQIADVAEIQSPLVTKLGEILQRGVAEGRFRSDIDPVNFYITIASLCYFPVSNKHTLSAIFGADLGKEWMDRKAEEAADMLIAYLYLKDGGGSDKNTENKDRP